jgi:Flp pilus assembly protein TadD
MNNSLRFGPAVSAIALATIIAGCATPQSGVSGGIFGGKIDTGNIGLATRAMVALNANDYVTAINFAERAVENSPRDAGFRALLGNAYFGAGRFASAEAAYRDSLSLYPGQRQVVLKSVLVMIAQGRKAEALEALGVARDQLDSADYGLALALAGEPRQAVDLLEAAARDSNADGRVRQNLALAHALSGDWEAARAVASQDLSPDLVDARIQQWMTFAVPHGPSDQVAALTGVKPALSDPGQPVRLALNPANTRSAQATAPAQQPVAEIQVAETPPAPTFVPAPAPDQTFVASADALAPTAPSRSEVAAAPEPKPAAVMIAAAAAAAPDAPSAFAAMAALTRKPQAVKKPARARVQQASMPRVAGKSSSVVQLGAYGSADRVGAAWRAAARRFSVLRGYLPMSARFHGPKGVVYRLSVRGFHNADQAKNLCVSLRRSGGNCFVRSVAGDVPVRIASR